MGPSNLKLAEVSHSAPARAKGPEGHFLVPAGRSLEFMACLARKNVVTGDVLSKFASADRPGKERKLRELWELTDLSADAFADEVAQFYKLPRLNLPQLLAAGIAFC